MQINSLTCPIWVTHPDWVENNCCQVDIYAHPSNCKGIEWKKRQEAMFLLLARMEHQGKAVKWWLHLKCTESHELILRIQEGAGWGSSAELSTWSQAGNTLVSLIGRTQSALSGFYQRLMFGSSSLDNTGYIKTWIGGLCNPLWYNLYHIYSLGEW